MIFTLSLIPIDKIPYQWEIIMLKVERIEEFVDYFAYNYFEVRFPMELWNHFLTTAEPRTNNHIEGYNLKQNKKNLLPPIRIFSLQLKSFKKRK